MKNQNVLTPEQIEYVPDEILFNFISKSLPEIKVIQMKLPIEVDVNGTDMYVSKAQIIGSESDDEQVIADRCLKFLIQEINKTGHKKIGIYKLLKNPGIELSKSTEIILQYAFPQSMKIQDVEDEYIPKFTKDIKPFKYNQGNILKNTVGE